MRTRSDQKDSSAVDLAVRSFAYGDGTPRLSEVEFSLTVGETLAVLGPSGCGKSTLQKLIAGLLPNRPNHKFSGSVALFGKPPEELRRSGLLSVMFQESTLYPNLTVAENIALPLRFLGRQDQSAIDDLLEGVGLGSARAFLPRQLSGGMKTRTALARSFVTQPKLLLLDEPFAALDLRWKRDLYTSLATLKAAAGTTVVMVTHDLEEAVYNSNHVLVLGANGTLIRDLVLKAPLPRPFDFNETISRFTSELDLLAHLLSKPSNGNPETSRAPLREVL
jgi:NitT/TauT family transport system ATP-binding protein